MNTDELLIRALVACYPAHWRRRYGQEYAQLLADLRVQRRPALILNSLLGSVRAHGGDTSMTKLIWATGLFTVAGIGYAKLAEDVTGHGRSTYTLLLIAAAVSLLALTAATLPGALALLRNRDKKALRYAAIPVGGAVVWYGVSRLALAIADHHQVHSAPTVLGFTLIAVAGVAVIAATAWAAAAVLRRVPDTRPARPAMLTTATGMAVTTLAALAWGLQTRPEWAAGNGILATPFLPSWILVVLGMAAATALATSTSLPRQGAGA